MTETSDSWNAIWAGVADLLPEPDAVLIDRVRELKPGRAMDLCCGAGANAVWLAEQGWRVTAVDYAEAALEKGRRLAAEREVDVEFVVADASTFQIPGWYDLITLFYIQLQPELRAKVLSTAAAALSPGGALLFVSHDRTDAPEGWEEADTGTLTTPEEVVSELPGLEIQEALVLEHNSTAHMKHSDDGENAAGFDDRSGRGAHFRRSTVVRGIRRG